jgi:hypothetical protein
MWNAPIGRPFSLDASDLANVAIAQGNRCSVSGSYFRFRRSGDGWQSEGILVCFSENFFKKVLFMLVIEFSRRQRNLTQHDVGQAARIA